MDFFPFVGGFAWMFHRARRFSSLQTRGVKTAYRSRVRLPIVDYGRPGRVGSRLVQSSGQRRSGSGLAGGGCLLSVG